MVFRGREIAFLGVHRCQIAQSERFAGDRSWLGLGVDPQCLAVQGQCLAQFAAQTGQRAQAAEAARHHRVHVAQLMAPQAHRFLVARLGFGKPPSAR